MQATKGYRRLTGQARGRLVGDGGFTLLEVLAVILIIGILAAIAIPSFVGSKAKAVDAQAKALVRNAQTAAEAVAAENGGSYEAVTPASLNHEEPALPISASSGGAYLVRASGGHDEYTLTARAAGGDEITITKDSSGEVRRECISRSSRTGCDGGESSSW